MKNLIGNYNYKHNEIGTNMTNKWSGNDISLLEADLLGRGVVKLEEAHLRRASLTKHQLHHLASQVTATSRLRCLDLSHNDLSALQPALLAGLVASLDSALLDETQLSEAQVRLNLVRFPAPLVSWGT